LSSLKEEQYAKPLDLLNQTSIGKHVRHIVEFYECLNESILLGGCLDYDLRNRNEEYENSPGKVSVALSSIMNKLEQLTNLKNSITLKFMTCPESTCKTEISSTIERELAYNLEHAIHHMAILKIAIKYYFSECKMDEQFGIAPSTIKYNRTIEAIKN